MGGNIPLSLVQMGGEGGESSWESECSPQNYCTLRVMLDGGWTVAIAFENNLSFSIFRSLDFYNCFSIH